MAQFHKWSVSELEDLYPFERDAYAGLLRKHLEEQAAKQGR